MFAQNGGYCFYITTVDIVRKLFGYNKLFLEVPLCVNAILISPTLALPYILVQQAHEHFFNVETLAL